MLELRILVTLLCPYFVPFITITLLHGLLYCRFTSLHLLFGLLVDVHILAALVIILSINFLHVHLHVDLVSLVQIWIL